jgi:hypothetical protein
MVNVKFAAGVLVTGTTADFTMLIAAGKKALVLRTVQPVVAVRLACCVIRKRPGLRREHLIDEALWDGHPPALRS